MRIKRFAVAGLNKRVDFDFTFHDDINIFTGANGSGKTTALKLAWYLTSGHTIRIRNEIDFKSCLLETDTFRVELQRLRQKGDIECTFSSFIDEETEFNGLFSEDLEFDSDGDPTLDGEDHLRDLIRESSESSIYFPTFRRIEGGYSLTATRRSRGTPNFGVSGAADMSVGAQLELLSRDLSFDQHKFVCSVSTDDIGSLLTERYAKASEGLNAKYTDFSAQILKDIRNWEQSGSDAKHSENLLLSIQGAANEIDAFREVALKPFDVLSTLVSDLFSYQGVKVRQLALGDAAKAIDSDILSAGEKQMLSFLVYNAFAKHAPIFIDEPELSLHPDWQRRLFPTLLDQQATNQFIVSTHSPFIYAKYEDRELAIGQDRGE